MKAQRYKVGISSDFLDSNLVIIWLTAGRGSWRCFLLLSRGLLGYGCHGCCCWSAGHKDELWGDGGPQGAVDLQDSVKLVYYIFKIYQNACWRSLKFAMLTHMHQIYNATHPQVHLSLPPRRPTQQDWLTDCGRCRGANRTVARCWPWPGCHAGLPGYTESSY